MKKSELRAFIRKTLVETDDDSLLQMKIKNPETGNDIKLKSALGYSEDSQVYKAAAAAHAKAKEVLKKDKEGGDSGEEEESSTETPSFSDDQIKSFKSHEDDVFDYDRDRGDVGQPLHPDPGKGPEGYDQYKQGEKKAAAAEKEKAAAAEKEKASATEKEKAAAEKAAAEKVTAREKRNAERAAAEKAAGGGGRDADNSFETDGEEYEDSDDWARRSGLMRQESIDDMIKPTNPLKLKDLIRR